MLQRDYMFAALFQQSEIRVDYVYIKCYDINEGE